MMLMKDVDKGQPGKVGNPEYIMATHPLTIMPLQNSVDTIRPVCYHIFSTMKGLNSHLKTALQCHHWGKGKQREINNILFSESQPSQPSDVEMDL